MIWAIFIIILVSIGLVLGAPFLSFLAPSNDIVLGKYNHETKTHDIIAYGAETLWYQWQSWAYIAIFLVLLTIFLSLAAGYIQQISDDDIAKKREQLDNEKQRYQQLQQTFKAEKEKEIWNSLLKEQGELMELKEQIELQYEHSQHTLEAAEKKNQITNFRIRAQSKEVRSKNAQRDRLSKQKKSLINFLEQAGWTYEDGKAITYQSLLQLAQQYEREK